MPPKQKFTREEMIAASLNIVRREGMEGVTARALGAELDCSSRPIFTEFQNMDEVQQETIQAAKDIYNGYIEIGLSQKLAFKGVGMEYIRFAKEEPMLFQLLFMTSKSAAREMSSVLPSIDENSDRILRSVHEEYGIKHKLTRERSYKLYQYIWIFTHGIAVLTSTGMCDFTEAELSDMLREVFVGIFNNQIMRGEEKIHD